MKSKSPNYTANKHKLPSSNNSKPIHKQFELLYRTRQGIPSSDQYQSVFFMKHHKIEPPTETTKQKRTKKKRNRKQKKKSEEKPEHAKSNYKKKEQRNKKVNLAHTTSTIPLNMYSNMNGKQLFSQSFRQTIDMDNTNLKKFTNTSNSNTSRYLNPKYQKTLKKTKSKPKAQMVCHPPLDFSETRKITSRVPSTIHSPKNPLKKQITKERQSQSEYIFYNGDFIKASNIVFSQISTKIHNLQIEQTNGHNQFLQNILIDSHSSHSIKHIDNSKEFQLSAVEKFINSKVLLIQRWWRKILKSRKKQIYAERVPKAHDSFDLKQQESRQQTDSLEVYLVKHEQSVLSIMTSNKIILNKLKQTNQIGNEEYADKLSLIEMSFQKEMLTIGKIRNLVNNQFEKISELEQKVTRHSEIASRVNSYTKEEIMESLFQEYNKENLGCLIPQNKQKSNGCHISQAVTTPIHSIPEMEREMFDKEGEENQEFEKQIEDEIQLADDIQGSFNNLLSGTSLTNEEYQNQQNIQAEIQKRYGVQVGIIAEQYGVTSGISTSVLSIHNFLGNFLKFYAYFYKEEFLKFVNMPYGHSINTRLKYLQKHAEQLLQSEEDGIIYGLQSIIGYEVLEDYHEHNYANLDISNKDIIEMVQYQKIHNRAIIDSFNESINQYRPYFYVNGQPYAWNYSQKALTFYFIAEQNIQEVFQKTQYKILRNASFLNGMIVQNLLKPSQVQQDDSLHETMIKYRNSVNQVLCEARQQKLNKLEKVEIEEETYLWQNSQESRTQILLEISNILAIQLVLEASCELPFSQ